MIFSVIANKPQHYCAQCCQQAQYQHSSCRTADGTHYNPDDEHGVNMVGGAAPILSPDFQGKPTSPTPPAGDSSTRHATTEY
ncbi:hypothetical protein [Kluyvera intermedia]|uniref:hypothetical protein n=1 Tax=Kluyvera intermedia TaxID=61648 RepID=UPI0035260E66